MLDSSIEILKGIGDKRKDALNACGIFTIRDLLYLFPYKYKDITKREYFDDKEYGDEVVSFVKVVSKPFYKKLNKNLSFLTFNVHDGKSSAKCTFFNQPYLRTQIEKDMEFLILGTVEKKRNTIQLSNPKIIYINDDTPNIITYYRLPKAIKQKSFLKILKNVFLSTSSQLAETLPVKIRETYKLCSLDYAINQVHFPSDMNALDSANYRLAFEEMFYFLVILKIYKKQKKDTPHLSLSISDAVLNKMISTLPFSLTNDQNKVVAEIRDDIAGKNANTMNRLLQGDVGSGKTIVAIIALYIAYTNDYQSAMMAPTEILANQHYNDCKDVLAPLGLSVVLLTASMKAKDKQKILSQLEFGEIDVIIGTHALIQDKIIFKNLGLAITDEQHRFGVNQRAQLSKKGSSPHLLVMSATPVPRTLALIVYSDLDISTINELPPGRKKIETRIVQSKKRNDMYNYIAKEIANDQQAYIVCPLIDESDKLDVLSAVSIYEELSANVFKGIQVGLIHGKMTDDKKQEMLHKFNIGTLRALVATTVIEVGVNVPSATIMVIENAERFGLAQLHQLRGRVGRGNKASWCFMTTNTSNATSLERVKILTSTNDGFEIARKDLELRGPGQFLGVKQSGLLDKRVLALINDIGLITKVKEAVDLLENKEFGDCSQNVYNEATKRYKSKLKNIVLN